MTYFLGMYPRTCDRGTSCNIKGTQEMSDQQGKKGDTGDVAQTDKNTRHLRDVEDDVEEASKEVNIVKESGESVENSDAEDGVDDFNMANITTDHEKDVEEVGDVEKVDQSEWNAEEEIREVKEDVDEEVGDDLNEVDGEVDKGLEDVEENVEGDLEKDEEHVDEDVEQLEKNVDEDLEELKESVYDEVEESKVDVDEAVVEDVDGKAEEKAKEEVKEKAEEEVKERAEEEADQCITGVEQDAGEEVKGVVEDDLESTGEDEEVRGEDRDVRESWRDGVKRGPGKYAEEGIDEDVEEEVEERPMKELPLKTGWAAKSTIEKPEEKGKSLGEHHHDLDPPETLKDPVFKTLTSDEPPNSGTYVGTSDKLEPLRQIELQTEPIQTEPMQPENTAIQAMPSSEDIKTLLSQIANFASANDALQGPRRTALGTRNFISYVLNPRGIHIDMDESKTESAFDHFKSIEPPQGSDVQKHYTDFKGLHSSTVWINPTSDVIQAIHNNYSEMHQSVPKALCEPEWVDDAVKYLLKSEPRRELQTKPSSPPRWLPVRMREESFRPQDGGVWEMPPVVHKDMPVDLSFNFNVQPDCSYWIWTGGFRPEICGKLTSLASVRFRRSLCPYLTVEVKRDNKGSSKGRQQIAAAASTALYNRWTLRARSLRMAGTPLSRERFSDVRHYGLLLAGVKYEVWCMRPHNQIGVSRYSTSAWSGCSMRRVHSGDLDTKTGITDYINWINEIHCWGNTRHSSSCVSDIEARLIPEGKALTNTFAQLTLTTMDDLGI